MIATNDELEKIKVIDVALNGIIGLLRQAGIRDCTIEVDAESKRQLGITGTHNGDPFAIGGKIFKNKAGGFAFIPVTVYRGHAIGFDPPVEVLKSIK